MSYDYQKERAALFTNEGQKTLLLVRDHLGELFRVAGAATIGKAISISGGGDSWALLACVDRLIEIGEVEKICTQAPTQAHVIRPRGSWWER